MHRRRNIDQHRADQVDIYNLVSAGRGWRSTRDGEGDSRSHRGGRGIETPIAHSRHLAAITGRGVRALLHLLGECQRVEAVECLPKGAHLAGANVDHLDECRKLGKLATKLSP